MAGGPHAHTHTDTRAYTRTNAQIHPPTHVHRHRRKRYAATLVADLSQYILDHTGKDLVFLFADQSNAQTNRMYQQVGFEFVGNMFERNFRPIAS